VNLEVLRTIKINPDDRRDDVRSVFEHDYARLIHSPAFRRLQGKSQIFGAGSGDYFRTRLTHSLEVSQIARHVAIKLTSSGQYTIDSVDHPGLIINPQVVECAALVHDIGHPPFGHKGEEVLNRVMPIYQNATPNIHFEGNAQNFRILMFLDKRRDKDGLDLSSSVLLALNKYPYLGDGSNIKGLYSTEWEYINTLRSQWDMPERKRTLEAQLMDLCDDIAYSSHDIEDGIKSKKIELNAMMLRDSYFIDLLVKELIEQYPEGNVVWEGDTVKARVTSILDSYHRKWDELIREYDYDQSRARREFKAYTVNRFVSNIGVIDDDGWKKVAFVRGNTENFELLRDVIVLKKLAWVTMIKDLRVQRLQKRSEKIIEGLWDAFISDTDGKIIPSDWMERFSLNSTTWSWDRFVVDYISGMTDAFAEKIYGELNGFNTRSIYDLD
jgi:dGTPase